MGCHPGADTVPRDVDGIHSCPRRGGFEYRRDRIAMKALSRHTAMTIDSAKDRAIVVGEVLKGARRTLGVAQKCKDPLLNETGRHEVLEPLMLRGYHSAQSSNRERNDTDAKIDLPP